MSNADDLLALADRCEREEPGAALDCAIDLSLGFCPHIKTTYEAVQGDSGRTCDDCGADSWGNRNDKGRRLDHIWASPEVAKQSRSHRVLEDVRQRGYAIAEQETYLGDMSVAAPVLDASGRPVAAVNIAVPTTRWNVADCRRTLVPMVLETARVISAEIGAAPSHS